MLAVDSLTVRRDGVDVLRSVTFAIRSNQATAIIGPNGAGKTTLSRVLVGLSPTAAGTMSLEDGHGRTMLNGLPSWRMAHLGLAYVPETSLVFAELTVRDNIAMARSSLSMAARNNAAALGFVLDLFPVLRDRMQQRAGTMSGGEQRMLAISRALLFLRARRLDGATGNPGILIVDEPSHGLHPEAAGALAKTLKNVRESEGIVMLLLEQHQSFARSCCDRFLTLDRGILTGDAEPSDERVQSVL